MKRENAGSWNSGLEKEHVFGIYKKYWANKVPEGGHQRTTRVEGAPYPLGTPPDLVGPWQASGAHLWLYGVF